MNRLIKNSFFYTAFQALQKGVGFLLLPLYTAYLSPDDYGTLGLITACTGFLNIFFLFVMDGACGRFEYVYPDPEERKTTWGTGLRFVVVNSLALGAVVFVFRDYVIAPFLSGIPFFPCVAVGLATLVIGGPSAVYLAKLRARQDGLSYSVLNLIGFSTAVAFTVLFVVKFRAGALGVLGATLISTGVSSLIGVHRLWKEGGARFSPARAKELLAYAAPLIPHLVASWALVLVDRLYLHHFKGPAEVGLFVIAFQIGSLIAFLSGALNQAYAPWFFEETEKGEAGRRQIARVAQALTTFYGFVGFSISLFAQEIVQLMTRGDYQKAWTVVPLIAFSSVFGGLYYVFVNPLFLKKTKWVPLVTLGSAGLGMLFNWILIPRWGGMGAGAAALISGFASSAIALALSAKKENYEFQWVRLYAIAGFYLAASLAVYGWPRGAGASAAGATLSKVFYFFLVAGVSLVWSKRDVMDLAAALRRRAAGVPR